MSLPRVLLQVYIGRRLLIAVRPIVFDQLESELNHLSGDEELLEDRRLLTVLGEDEELSQELEGLEVLKGDALAD